jgi:MFS transporter, ACS family, pantothenate transporter
MGSNAINAWWSIVFYGANYAPYFTIGMYAMIAVSIAMAIWTALLVYMQVRTEKRRETEATATTIVSKGVDGPEEENQFGRDEVKV